MRLNKKMFKKAVIKGIASYLPEEKISNEMLSEMFIGWDIHKVYQNTGVVFRSISKENQCTSDLAVLAAQKLFFMGVCKPEEVEFLLFCTQTPDYYLPPSACLIQHQLGLPESCGALDYNLGCSGFVYGLSLAKALIETDLTNNVLLLTGDTPSKAINKKDRGAFALFSDGCSATFIVGLENDKDYLGPFVFGTDGKGAKNLIIPAGGFRQRYSPLTKIEKEDELGNVRSLENLYMDGAEIFNFTLKAVPKSVNELFDKTGLTMDDIDYVVFHQANKFMLETLRRKLKIPPDKFALILENYGNTSSASIPMALEVALQDGKITKGSKILISGFGVGYSWATGLITWN